MSWLLAGWSETQERIRINSLIYVSKGSIKEFAQLVLEVVGQDHGSYDRPTTDALKEAHKRHLAYLKRQFPELPHIRDASCTAPLVSKRSPG